MGQEGCGRGVGGYCVGEPTGCALAAVPTEKEGAGWGRAGVLWTGTGEGDIGRRVGNCYYLRTGSSVEVRFRGISKFPLHFIRESGCRSGGGCGGRCEGGGYRR